MDEGEEAASQTRRLQEQSCVAVLQGHLMYLCSSLPEDLRSPEQLAVV